MPRKKLNRKKCKRCREWFQPKRKNQKYCSKDCVRSESFGGGRPSIVTIEVIEKLETAFSMGCTDDEACLFAGISADALYYHQKNNPKFADRKRLLKQTPVLAARASVCQGLEHDPKLALAFLERRKADEFAPVTGAQKKTLPTGADGAVNIKVVIVDD